MYKYIYMNIYLTSDRTCNTAIMALLLTICTCPREHC
uniref:Uncharacterized protein n=1 Tax=Anguilla anguilla TaxID=7936 RepID=A0A0E9PVY4_ANGAN